MLIKAREMKYQHINRSNSDHRDVGRRNSLETLTNAVAEDGSWTTVPYQWSNHETSYLVSNVTKNTDISTVTAIFPLEIQQTGNYTIFINTPGCSIDQSCDTRGAVNVTIDSSPTNCAVSLITTQIQQTSENDKEDRIYTGVIARSTNEFTPRIILTPFVSTSRQDLPLTIVAHAARYQQLSLAADPCGEPTSQSTEFVSLTPPGTHSPQTAQIIGIAIGVTIALFPIFLLAFNFVLHLTCCQHRGFVPAVLDDKPELHGVDIKIRLAAVEKDAEAATAELDAIPVCSEVDATPRCSELVGDGVRAELAAGKSGIDAITLAPEAAGRYIFASMR